MDGVWCPGSNCVYVVLVVFGVLYPIWTIHVDPTLSITPGMVVWAVVTDILIMHFVAGRLAQRFSLKRWRMSFLYDPSMIIFHLVSLLRVYVTLSSSIADLQLYVLVVSSLAGILFTIAVICVLWRLGLMTTTLRRSTVGFYARVTFFSCRLLVIRKSFNGTQIRVCTSLVNEAVGNDMCSICHDCLSVRHSRKSAGSLRSRANLSLNRTKVYGATTLFYTSCGHVFHQECLMKWVSEKPIRMHIAIDPPHQRHINPSRTSGDQASCPLCKSPIELQIADYTFNTFRLLLFGGI